MKTLRRSSPITGLLVWFVGVCFLVFLPLAATTAAARPKNPPPAPGRLYVFFIDQLAPQGAGPAFNGLDERRRGPLFAAVLQQLSREGKLPASVFVINRDLSLPATLPEEPAVPAGATLARIYLTQWSQTALGGVADTEILCRCYVQVLRAGRATRELGPFFARQRYDPVTATLPEERQAQFQAAARQALEKMAAALRAS